MKLITIYLTAILAAIGLLSSVSAQDSGAIRHKTKKPKKPKKPKKSKLTLVKPDALTALIENLSDSEVFGASALRYSGDGAALLSVGITGLDATMGSAVITDGTSCDASSSDYSETPSLCPMGTSSYIEIDTLRQSGAESVTRSAQRLDNGCTAHENEGKTVIIYNGPDPTSSSAVGCGILGMEVEKKILIAMMGSYPGYDGELSPSGTVAVTFNVDQTFTFQFAITGVLPNCVDCGIHIHAGTSCESHALVKGHGWNSLAVRDLWFASEGAVYNSDDDGNAVGFFTLSNGFGYEPNLNHAVVIHTASGERVGCGLLY